MILNSIQSIDKTALQLKTMAHPIRLRMVMLLNEIPHEFSVTEFEQRLEISKSSASHHLSLMRGRGILTSRSQGNERYYSLVDMRFAKSVFVLLE